MTSQELDTITQQHIETINECIISGDSINLIEGDVNKHYIQHTEEKIIIAKIDNLKIYQINIFYIRNISSIDILYMDSKWSVIFNVGRKKYNVEFDNRKNAMFFSKTIDILIK